MALRVVGAGLPRTSTLSLKAALERLLGGKCYHMAEVLENPQHALTWADAVEGRAPEWDDTFLKGYTASVDWPASAMWKELSAAYPDALILLSVRESAEQWWNSIDKTIFTQIRGMRQAAEDGGAAAPPYPGGPEMQAAMGRMFQSIVGERFEDIIDDKDAAMKFYEHHLAEVRVQAPADRLLEWKAAQGWEPLCAALGVPVPDEPFPSSNSTQEFNEADWFNRG